MLLIKFATIYLFIYIINKLKSFLIKNIFVIVAEIFFIKGGVMRGKILDFSIQENTGYISGDDGKRYSFVGVEWKEASPPKKGDDVDFDVDQSGNAAKVFLSLSANNSTPVNTDEEGYNIWNWFCKCFENYINFSGRARRKEFWFFTLFCLLLGVAFGVIEGIFDASGIDAVVNIITLIDKATSLALFLPSLAVAIRRLHDTGRSGWWYLLVFTIIGIIPLIIWFSKSTDPKANKWGVPAK